MANVDIETVAAVLALLVAAAALLRAYIVTPLIRVHDDMKSMEDVRDNIVEIRAELRRNGGLTVKDAIVRVEESQARLEVGLNQIKDRQDAHFEYHLEEGKP